MTEFSGIHFDENDPYNYSEGKRLIRIVMGELRYHPELKALINTKVGGRDAITGKGRAGVWDYLHKRKTNHTLSQQAASLHPACSSLREATPWISTTKHH